MPLTRVVLTELAHGGDAVGHVEVGGERRAVFVTGGAVGDRVEVEIDLSKRPARGSIVQIIEPGPERVEPPCKHASRCGGCDWMHLSHEGQLRAHEAHVREAVGEGVAIELHPATQTERYRERARLHARVKGGHAIVGPNEARSAHALAIETCLALHPTLDAARKTVGEALEGARGTAEVGLALGAIRPERRAVLELRFSGELPNAAFTRLEQQTKAGALDGARVWMDDVRSPAVIGDPTPWVMGIDGAPLRLSPGGFAQTHSEMNRELGAFVLAHCGEGKLVELYAGSGNLTVGLARQLPQVISVESEAASVEAARANLEARSLHAKLVCADAETYALPGDTATVVLDPPRTGAKIVCEALAKSKARRIVYVSCDPPSLKRDLAALRARFSVRACAMFEMFPHTSHVESVVVLVRGK